MPIYEYLCEKCEHEFEREQRITEDPVKTCPDCRSRKVKRLISRTSFVLKGGGWYNDLYSSSKKDGKSGKDAGGSGDAKTETGDAAPAAQKSESSESKSAATKDSGSGESSGKAGKKAGSKGSKSAAA